MCPFLGVRSGASIRWRQFREYGDDVDRVNTTLTSAQDETILASIRAFAESAYNDFFRRPFVNPVCVKRLVIKSAIAFVYVSV
jgi:hypothetical protein